ncbi:hypothetical protein F2Q68_00032134 [Brassica cretica]|uniref:Uncharacterized protein n=1 Tax=Brassica cretica TaxID=69181 RepID=A0A8S9GGR0_BRACR|nr:hypothetical protein F2Q68_00032134 [Brassica cretica]
MASLTIRPEPVKQKKRPNYQINNNRYCTYCAFNRDHQWPFELSRKPLGKAEGPSRLASENQRNDFS